MFSCFYQVRLGKEVLEIEFPFAKTGEKHVEIRQNTRCGNIDQVYRHYNKHEKLEISNTYKEKGTF